MSRTVLVVDDVPFVRKTISDILTQARYQVVGEASNSDEAFQMARRLKPDFVTMDLVMPGASGVEAIRKILKEEKEISILVVSAMGQESLMMEAINAGAVDYIMKPIVAKDLIKSMDRIFAGKSAAGVKSSLAGGA